MSDPRRTALIVRKMPPIFAGGGADTTDLRAYYYTRLWEQWSGSQRLLGRALCGLPSIGSQSAATAWRLGFRCGNLAEVDARRKAGARLEAFLDQDERKGIHAIINHMALPLDTNPLKNKFLFEETCRRASLPLPATIASADDAAAHRALVSKPRFGSKGVGVMRLVRLLDGGFQSSCGGLTVSANDLGAWLAAQQAKGRIVQECLETHPSVAAMSPGALPTLRVVTVINERGDPEVTDAALRLSLEENRAADNFNIDNLVAPVALDSGLLGPALRRVAKGFAESDDHPTTGARIAGEFLELLPAALELAREAHTCFSARFALVGWDIGLASVGPVLIEGNWNPGYNVLQLVHGTGVGDLRLGELYRFHLTRAPAIAWQAATPLQVAQRPWRKSVTDELLPLQADRTAYRA